MKINGDINYKRALSPTPQGSKQHVKYVNVIVYFVLRVILYMYMWECISQTETQCLPFDEKADSLAFVEESSLLLKGSAGPRVASDVTQ